MSLITFRDRNTSGTPVGPTWYLNFDALTVEELTRSAELTQYPVETGATLSDHYQPLPREISLTGIVSETPSGPWTNIEKMQNAAAPPVMATRPLRLQVQPSPQRVGALGIPRPISTSVLPGRRVIQSNIERARLYIPQFAQTLQITDTGSAFTNRGVTRVARFVEMLDGLMGGRFVVTVILQTGAEYQNMMITEMRAPRIAGSSGAITLSLDLQEVVLASPVTETKAAQTRAEPKQKPKKAKGRKGKKPVKVGTPEERRLQSSLPEDQRNMSGGGDL